MKDALQNKCQTFDYHFVDNNNTTAEKLWKDSLYLVAKSGSKEYFSILQIYKNSPFNNKRIKKF